MVFWMLLGLHTLSLVDISAIKQEVLSGINLLKSLEREEEEI